MAGDGLKSPDDKVASWVSQKKEILNFTLTTGSNMLDEPSEQFSASQGPLAVDYLKS